MAAPVLVADIGATHARFALATAEGLLGPALHLPTATYRDLASAARGGLSLLRKSLPFEGEIRSAAIAVAGPVTGDAIELTNAGWKFSIEASRRELGLARLLVLNDFEALAWSVPRLKSSDLEMIRGGEGARGAPIALIGPGTGLGVGALVPVGAGWRAIAGEGGHRDLAASTEREWQVIGRLAARFGHVSAERTLSGPGLSNLHRALCELGHRTVEALEPSEVAARARSGDDVEAVEAAGLFSEWLGAVAGDLALTLGARGGVYLGGGVISGLGAAFDRRRFVHRFEGKGRFEDYLRRIPIRYILSSDAALLGAAAALDLSLPAPTAGAR
jgi:glucokinase